MKSTGIVGSIAIAVLSVASSVRGSPLVETVGSIGGNGGAQGVVSGPSASSSYFNPALLVDADEDVLLGFAVVAARVGVTLDGRNGGDVPPVVAGRDIIGPDGAPIPNDSVPTQWLQNGCPAGTLPGQCPQGFAARPRQSQPTSRKPLTYLALGLVRHIVADRLTIGMYALLPIGNFNTAQSHYADEREALFSNSLHPELYGDRLTAISVVFGAAFKILPELSIGAGVSIGLANVATSTSYVRDSTNYDTLLMNTGVTTQVNVSPTVGVRWAPVPWLRFGGAIHSPESFVVETNVTATLPSGTESSTSRRDVYDWMPWSVGLGAEADVAHRGSYSMSLAGSLGYAFWSSYEDRHGQNPRVYGSDLAWKDTMSGALGVRHRYRAMRAFVDLVYVPSPVPPQVGRSNYVDGSRVGFVLGADVDVKLPRGKIRPGVQLFVQRLIPRHQTKDPSRIVDELPDDAVFASTHDPVPGASGLQTNNPGYPGFSSRGWLWGFVATLQFPL